MSGMLKERRTAAGMSHTELAAKTGVSMRTIQHWERHGVLDAKAGSLKRAADALGCTVDELIDEEGA